MIDGLPSAIWPDDPSLVTETDCPELVRVPIAQTTTCVASLDSQPVSVPIVIDDEGAVTTEVREILFDVGVATDELESRLAEDLGLSAAAIDISCDRAVLIAAAEATATCLADRAGDIIGLRVVLLDETGRWEPQFGSM